MLVEKVLAELNMFENHPVFLLGQVKPSPDAQSVRRTRGKGTYSLTQWLRIFLTRELRSFDIKSVNTMEINH